jgi:hypothetical protein
MASTEAAAVHRLLAELRADRRALAARTGEVARFSVTAPDTGLPAERAAALALSLDRTYTALESIFERIARTLESGLPVGADWHRALLDDAVLDVPEVRPPVLSVRSARAADRLRRFRHFVRHAYAAELDPDQLTRLASVWNEIQPDLESDLDAFERFLQNLAARLEAPTP